MEVQFTPDQQAKLSRLAMEQGRAAEALVQEAVERLWGYDEWFSREVDKGLAAADQGECIEHDAIRGMIETWYLAEVTVRWTKPAAADLRHICDYTLGRFGAAQARRAALAGSLVPVNSRFPVSLS